GRRPSRGFLHPSARNRSGASTAADERGQAFQVVRESPFHRAKARSHSERFSSGYIPEPAPRGTFSNRGCCSHGCGASRGFMTNTSITNDRTQGFFHQYANDFDAIYSNRGEGVEGVLNRVFRKSMKLRFIKSVEGCQPIQGRTVLDVGCGPGHYS